MSTLPEASTEKSRKRVTAIVITGISVLIMLLVYGAGIIALPLFTLSKYQNKNCETALSSYRVYTSIYPRFIQDKTVEPYMTECKMYTLALQHNEQGKWANAYDGFTAYSKAYPSGLFAKEAHDSSAIMLIEMAKNELALKQHQTAKQHINIVLTEYADTNAVAKALELLPGLYIAWGSELRNAKSFPEAEIVFTEFKGWADTTTRTEDSKSAQFELAKNYLEWGLFLQSQADFEAAKIKFGQAIASDPDIQSSSGISAQVRANEATFNLEWGDALIKQKDYPAGIQHYELVLANSAESDQATAKDAIANAHIQWAKDLGNSEDFFGALDQLEKAKKIASSENAKNAVTDAFSQTYLLFSQSSGKQAREAIKDALESVCIQHKSPTLPIFGLDKENILVAIYGVDAKFPDTVSAKTPGSLHYIACVEQDTDLVDSKYLTFFYRDATGHVQVGSGLMQRIRVLWIVSLFESVTGKLVDDKQFNGGDPPAFPTHPRDYGNGYYPGSNPNVTELVEWLLLIIKK